MGSKTFALPSLGKHWSPKLGTVLDFGQPDTADRPRVEGAFCYCPISPLAEVLKSGLSAPCLRWASKGSRARDMRPAQGIQAGVGIPLVLLQASLHLFGNLFPAKFI